LGPRSRKKKRGVTAKKSQKHTSFIGSRNYLMGTLDTVLDNTDGTGKKKEMRRTEMGLQNTGDCQLKRLKNCKRSSADVIFSMPFEPDRKTKKSHETGYRREGSDRGYPVTGDCPFWNKKGRGRGKVRRLHRVTVEEYLFSG